MDKLVFATGNEHKVREVKAILGEFMEIISLKDIGCLEDIPETQATLEGNALQKARYVYEKYQKDCYSEDTGLEIISLNMEPGVFTARYAGPEKDPQANMDKVLEKLKDEKNRSARFRTVIALILDGKEHLFEGIAKGKIAQQKSGTDGFGYDPIFIPTGFETTFAEMSAAEKHSISHRAKAMQLLKNFLQKRSA